MKVPSILIVDDHALFRTGLSMILNQDGYHKIQQAGSVSEAIKYRTTNIDVILLDIQMPGINGIDGIAVLLTHFPGAAIIILSANEEPVNMAEAEVRGAKGFLLKSSHAEEISHAIMIVMNGGRFFPSCHADTMPAGDSRERLTARQLEVLRLLCEGKSNKIIARELDMAENTARVHVSAILARLGASSRAEAILIAQKRRIVGLPS
ncbi:MAG: response regulator transcription factor [Ketobacteraceae bacterium]|nr:response regulator transcription factor [Ketobacteraceae bacterium]